MYIQKTLLLIILSCWGKIVIEVITITSEIIPRITAVLYYAFVHKLGFYAHLWVFMTETF
jgi:hypothetical protein